MSRFASQSRSVICASGVGAKDRGGVDEDVDSAERVEDAGDHLLDLGDALEVGAECLRLAAHARDLGDDCVRLGVRVAIVNCDRRAAVGEFQCDRAADAATRAGYQRNFSLEVHARFAVGMVAAAGAELT